MFSENKLEIVIDSLDWNQDVYLISQPFLQFNSEYCWW